MKTNPAVLPPLLLATIVLAAACSGSGSPIADAPVSDEISGTGTVVYIEIEGGFYALQADDGTLYDPVDLPGDFRVDGLKVFFTVRILKDALSFHMVGPIVTVLDIGRLA